MRAYNDTATFLRSPRLRISVSTKAGEAKLTVDRYTAADTRAFLEDHRSVVALITWQRRRGRRVRARVRAWNTRVTCSTRQRESLQLP